MQSPPNARPEGGSPSDPVDQIDEMKIGEAETATECDELQEEEDYIESALVHPERGPACIEEETHVPSERRKKTPPAHSADAQVRRRAMKRYREIDGHWVKGKPDADGQTWIPQPDAPRFDSLQRALGHEKQKTAHRRSTRTNLRAHMAATRSAITVEAANVRAHTAEEAASTRREITSARDVLSEQPQEGVGNIFESQQHHARASDGCGTQLDFFARLLAMRTVDLRDLLAKHAIEPVGGKAMLASVAAQQLRPDDLDMFVAPRNKRPRTATQTPTGDKQQHTLDALFAKLPIETQRKQDVST